MIIRAGALLLVLFTTSFGFGQELRVFGGSNALEGQHPWMVDMRWFANEHLCGATLIHPEWVLTAGHCAITAWDENMMLVANSIANGNGFGPNADVLQYDTVYYPPGYDGTNGPDLALIHLSTPANTVPVPLWGPSDGPLPGTGAPARVLGWGVADTVTLFEADTLQVADVVLFDYDTCAFLYANAQYDFFGLNGTPGLICAGYFDGQPASGSGNADSGGPLMVQSGGTWKQAGVVYGGEELLTTAEYPGVFTTIAWNRPWIDSLIATVTQVVERNAPPRFQVVHGPEGITVLPGQEVPDGRFQLELIGNDGRLLLRQGPLDLPAHVPCPLATVSTAVLVVRDTGGIPVHRQLVLY